MSSFFTKFHIDLFDRDEKSHVTISSVTDRSNSVHSSYRSVSANGARKLIESQLAVMGLESQVKLILISQVEGIIA